MIAPEPYMLPYRSMDAGGSAEAAGAVAWRWIKEIRDENCGDDDACLMEIVQSESVIALYRGTKLLAVATLFRDPMNFAVLVRWKAAA